MKTSELIGDALDWAVAQCLISSEGYRDRGLLVHRIGYGQPMPKFSTDWALGDPIIKQEGIVTVKLNDYYFPNGNENGQHWEPAYKAMTQTLTRYGTTPLIAAMRCYVASKLGDDIDIPDPLSKKGL